MRSTWVMMSPVQREWTGSWVAERLGLRLQTTDSVDTRRLEDLVGLAVRRNPRRVQLLVSAVLGKHVPTDPRIVRDAGLRLGMLVRERVTGDAVVLGYAETATALGHLVADALDAPYLHSTRRAVKGVTPVGGFEEEHSHATSHLLLPERTDLLAGAETVVLVDDELSTGRTVVNTVAALHADHPRSHYVVASLVDVRSTDDRACMEAAVRDLGASLTCVSLVAGAVELPADLAEKGAALLARATEPVADRAAREPGALVRLAAPWPHGVRESGRHGFVPGESGFDGAVAATVAAVAEVLPAGPVHVLGTEELIYAPLRIATGLAENRPEPVTFSSTTRSPVLAVDEPGYAIRTALSFAAHDRYSGGPEDPGRRFVYNLREGAYAAIVLVLDDPGDTAELGGLLDALRGITDLVVTVTLPAYRPRSAAPEALPEPLRGPEFGSYSAADVGWLLTDLSDAELEAPTEEREEAIQTGRAHYAESLPVEYHPDAAYEALFGEALRGSAERMAYAVGLVAEQILALPRRPSVLVSLARAGTPVGVLIRRWAQAVHELDLPHYAISIVRGRGIDEVGLAYLAAHHDPAEVIFVDGWTGKGAITRELAAAIAKANAALGTAFSAELAVLADPGRCVQIYGTREDYLIASACLNSTVSGLVSRTVLNDALIGPGDFHGAKFYAHLRAADVSALFVDTVAARFPAVRTRVLGDLGDHLAADHTPTWDGWRIAEEVAAAYGIGEVNLVKPGVGETTRVLLRRVPWRVLVNPERSADLAHIRALAAQRGVPLEEVSGLPYSCIGLIHPRFTRGAVVADGRGAAGRSTEVAG